MGDGGMNEMCPRRAGEGAGSARGADRNARWFCCTIFGSFFFAREIFAQVCPADTLRASSTARATDRFGRESGESGGSGAGKG